MKTFTKMVAAVLTASLALCSAAPVKAENNDISYDILIPIENTPFAPSFNSDEEMLKYIRSKMCNRIESFSVARKGMDIAEADDYRDKLLTKIFDYTGNPKEGNYLFLGVRNINASTYSENDIFTIDFKVSYMTTYDQEAELDTQIKNLVSAMPLILGNNYQNLPDAEKIAKGYDYFVKLMKNVEHVEDKNDPSLYSAYSVLINKKANSIGFVQLFIRTLAEIGIESKVILTPIDLTGKLGSHFIPAVCIDGTYYLCDPVSDFILGNGDNKFLLKGVNDFDSSEEYKQAVEKQGTPLNKLAEQNGVALYSYDKKFEFGDVSGDGLIDSVDASMILAEYARLSTSDKCGIFSAGQKTAADIDKNGHIDSVDTSIILSYYAYKSTSSDNKTLSDFVSKK